MLWLSAEKQALIFSEFFNRIDPERTLDEVISMAGNGTLRSYDQQSSLASSVNSR